jgi:hypothetical protein
VYMKKRRTLLWLLLLVLLVLAIGIASRQKGSDQVTGHAVTVGAPEDDTNTGTGEDEILLNDTSGSGDTGDSGTGDSDEGDTGDSDEEDTETPPAEPEPVYPDNIYPDKCTAESCEAPAVCHEGECKTPECSTDEDCFDGNDCTSDTCFFAGHPNAFCSDEVIRKRIDGDGCCPKYADASTDIDCTPVCGNHKCEYGESVAMCALDCQNAGGGQGPPAPPPPPPPSET